MTKDADGTEHGMFGDVFELDGIAYLFESTDDGFDAQDEGRLLKECGLAIDVKRGEILKNCYGPTSAMRSASVLNRTTDENKEAEVAAARDCLRRVASGVISGEDMKSRVEASKLLLGLNRDKLAP